MFRLLSSRRSEVRAARNDRRPASRAANRFRPRLEELEGRLVPTTFSVTTLADNGDDANPVAGSLRAAILAANASSGADSIDFAVTGTIRVQTNALPGITDTLHIAGPTDSAANPLVTLDGSALGSSGYIALHVEAPDSSVRGLKIVDFMYNGIVARGNDITLAGNVVSGMRVGDAIFVIGSNGQIYNNIVTANRVGIVVDGAGAVVEYNVVTGNEWGVGIDTKVLKYGVLVFSPDSLGNNSVTNNNLFGNATDLVDALADQLDVLAQYGFTPAFLGLTENTVASNSNSWAGLQQGELVFFFDAPSSLAVTAQPAHTSTSPAPDFAVAAVSAALRADFTTIDTLGTEADILPPTASRSDLKADLPPSQPKGTDNPALEFTFFAGTIEGTLFDDVNGNGLRDPGEQPLAFQIVYLDVNSNGQFDGTESWTVTNKRGEYSFKHLPPGEHTVRPLTDTQAAKKLVDQGYNVKRTPAQLPTEPATGSQKVELTQAQPVAADVNFGLRVLPRRPVFEPGQVGDTTPDVDVRLDRSYQDVAEQLAIILASAQQDTDVPAAN